MGLMDSIVNAAENAMQPGQTMHTEGQGAQNAQVAGGLLQALDQHPGGLAGVLAHFQQNGMGGHVDQMQNGQTAPLTPDQIQQGTQGTGLIDQVAQKAGISPEMAKSGMAVVLPMIVAHFSQNNNGQMPQQGEFGGLASQILGRFI